MTSRSSVYHAALADYFASKPLYLDGVRRTKPNARKAAELPWQQAHGLRSQELVETLLSFPFMEAKAQACGALSLIDDYGLSVRPELTIPGEVARQLDLMVSALKLCAHVVDQDFHELPGQLTGRLLPIGQRETAAFLASIPGSVNFPWLRTILPSMAPAGGPLLCSFRGHTSVVCTAVLSSDGAYAVTASDDSLEHYNDAPELFLSRDKQRLTIKIWDIGKRQLKRDIHTGLSLVYQMQVTPDAHLAVILLDKTLYAWDLMTGERRNAWSGVPGTLSAVSPDGHYAATVMDERVEIRDLSTGKLVSSHACGSAPVATILRDHTLIAQTKDGDVLLRDVLTGDEQRRLARISGRLLALSADGNALIGIQDGALRRWDAATGQPIRTLVEQFGTVKTSTPEGESLTNLRAFTPDCRYAIAISPAEKVVVWDTERGIELAELTGVSGSDLTSGALSADGRYAVTGCWDRTVRMWSIEPTPAAQLPGRRTGTLQTMSHDREGVIVREEDGTMAEYSFALERLRALNPGGDVMGVLPDNRTGLVREGAALHLVDMIAGKRLKTMLARTINQDPRITTLALLPDGDHVVCGYGASVFDKLPKPLKVWNLLDGCEVMRMSEPAPGTMLVLTGYPGHLRDVSAITVTPDNKYVVSGDVGGLIAVWSRVDGAALLPLSLHRAAVTTLDATPDARFIISGSADGMIIVWDLAAAFLGMREPPIVVLQGHTDVVRKVVVTPDALHAISVSDDKSLKAWDLREGRCIASLELDEALVDCCIAGDGATIVAGSRNNHLALVKLENVTRGPTIATAWQLPRGKRHFWNRDTIAFGCRHCHSWAQIDSADLGAAFACPGCGELMRVNPFTIEGDWRHMARIWKTEAGGRDGP